MVAFERAQKLGIDRAQINIRNVSTPFFSLLIGSSREEEKTDFELGSRFVVGR